MDVYGDGIHWCMNERKRKVMALYFMHTLLRYDQALFKVCESFLTFLSQDNELDLQKYEAKFVSVWFESIIDMDVTILQEYTFALCILQASPLFRKVNAEWLTKPHIFAAKKLFIVRGMFTLYLFRDIPVEQCTRCFKGAGRSLSGCRVPQSRLYS
jgi:hypothetical protein